MLAGFIKAANSFLPVDKQVEQLAFCQKIDNSKIIIKASLVGGEFSGNTALCLAYLALKNNKKTYIQLSGLNKILKVQKKGSLVNCYIPIPNKTLKPDYINGWYLMKLPGINHLIVPQFYQENRQFLFRKALKIINKNKQKLMSQKSCGIIFVKEKNQLFFSKPFIYFKQSEIYQLFTELATKVNLIYEGKLSQKK